MFTLCSFARLILRYINIFKDSGFVFVFLCVIIDLLCIVIQMHLTFVQ